MVSVPKDLQYHEGKSLTEETVKAKVLYFVILITSSIKTPRRSESAWAMSAITEFLERQAYNEGLEA